MYKKCPKCGHERAPGEQGPEDVCSACGLIFSKYLKARLASAAPARTDAARGDETEPGWAARAAGLALHVPEEVPAFSVYARAAFLVLLVVYGIHLARMDIPSWEISRSLMHAPMLPFHEFGHVLFRPFGEFMTLLGGSLFQAALPLILGGVFLVKNRDPFSASVMLWWCSVAVLDTAPYIYDAKTPQHILITGRTGDTGGHDFIDVLYDIGLLDQAQTVGYVVHRFGVVIMLLSFAWGAWIVWRQWGVRR